MASPTTGSVGTTEKRRSIIHNIADDVEITWSRGTKEARNSAGRSSATSAFDFISRTRASAKSPLALAPNRARVRPERGDPVPRTQSCPARTCGLQLRPLPDEVEAICMTYHGSTQRSRVHGSITPIAWIYTTFGVALVIASLVGAHIGPIQLEAVDAVLPGLLVVAAIGAILRRPWGRWLCYAFSVPLLRLAASAMRSS